MSRLTHFEVWWQMMEKIVEPSIVPGRGEKVLPYGATEYREPTAEEWREVAHRRAAVFFAAADAVADEYVKRYAPAEGVVELSAHELAQITAVLGPLDGRIPGQTLINEYGCRRAERDKLVAVVRDLAALHAGSIPDLELVKEARAVLREIEGNPWTLDPVRPPRVRPDTKGAT